MKPTLSTWAWAGVVAALCLSLLNVWPAATVSAHSATTSSDRCWVMQSNVGWQGPINTTFDDCVDRVGRYGTSDSEGSAYGYWSGMYVLITSNGQVYSAIDNGRFAWIYRGQWTRPANNNSDPFLYSSDGCTIIGDDVSCS